MIRAKSILANLNIKHFSQNIHYNELTRHITMYFMVFFKFLGYQSHLLTNYNLFDNAAKFFYNFNLSTDGSGNLKLKKYHKVHCNASSEFIIMYVLTKMFYV